MKSIWVPTKETVVTVAADAKTVTHVGHQMTFEEKALDGPKTGFEVKK